MSAPVKYIYDQCRQYDKTALIDEYNTTKKCHGCQEYLRVLHESNMGRKVEHDPRSGGIRRCLSPACRGHNLVSRDINAALNILSASRLAR